MAPTFYICDSCCTHERPQGGGGVKRGHLPPLEIKKYGGPHKDKLTRKNLKKKLKKN